VNSAAVHSYARKPAAGILAAKIPVTGWRA